MRQLASKIERKFYNDDFSLIEDMKINRGSIISNSIYESDIFDMVEGETRVDVQNSRRLQKINGELYKEVVNGSDVVLEKI